MKRSSRSHSAPAPRLRKFEQCEARIVFAEGHGWTDIEAIRSQYGLKGNNQAVAIIDSGIAYDHIALGGGLGAGKKVLGGWDFAEGDANPYDDGPSGFHGTHVAGIVAANDGTYPGVAPGASLVGLRVFQDNGTGNFSWIESALRWVHDNRNSLGVQITTVNLSIGTDWNAENTPNWAMLEDEFAMLKADGIFISVAAGNSFAKFNTSGLSYPASSPYVVPVSSVDATGLFSKFSQRSVRSIAAPGERIMSTVPDWFTGNDGVKNDWSLASGTSMAAPYVAGGSVLLREALTAFGRAANQDEIYNIMRNTASTFYDTVTNANYLKLNLKAAIDAIAGPDEFSNTASGAFNFGRNLSSTFAARFNTLSDSDYFTFVADKTGVLRLNQTNAGGGTQTWQVVGGAATQGNSLTLNVVAGQTYTIGLSSSAIGAYTITTTFTGTEVTTPPVDPTPPPTNPPPTPPPATPPINYIDWGTVQTSIQNNLQINGSAHYRLQASQSGFLSIEGVQTGGSGVTVELLNSAGNRVGIGAVKNGALRYDNAVIAGESYTLKISGATADLDLRLTNLVRINHEGRLEVNGTAAADRFDVDLGTSMVTVNGTRYNFVGLNGVLVHGAGGWDILNVTGDAAATERMSIHPGAMGISGGRGTMNADGFETIQAAMQKADNVTVQDGRTDDTLNVGLMSFSMSGFGYSLGVTGAGVATINMTAGGSDTGNFAAAAGRPQVNKIAGTVTAAAGGAIVSVKGLEQGYQFTTTGLKARLNSTDAFLESEFGGDNGFTPIAGLNDAVDEIAAANVLASTTSSVRTQSHTESLLVNKDAPTTSAAVFENLDVELESILAASTELQRELANVIGSAEDSATDADEEIQSRADFFASLDCLA